MSYNDNLQWHKGLSAVHPNRANALNLYSNPKRISQTRSLTEDILQDCMVQ